MGKKIFQLVYLRQLLGEASIARQAIRIERALDSPRAAGQPIMID
jgi:hypothetical protein